MQNFDGIVVMTDCPKDKNRDLVANMRHSVSKAVGVAGLTVAVSLPAVNAKAATDANDHQDVAKALQQVQNSIKAAGPVVRARAAGEKLAQWVNWRNWNNWRNF